MPYSPKLTLEPGYRQAGVCTFCDFLILFYWGITYSGLLLFMLACFIFFFLRGPRPAA